MSYVPASLHRPLEPLIDALPESMGRSSASGGTWADLVRLAGKRAADRLTGKRAVDVVGGGLGLFLLSPLLLVVVLLIRMESRGPALFRQTRLGRNGRPFRIYKFRTMVADAEERLGNLEHLNESEGGVLFKMRHDPRVTRIGRILRRTCLDELPQLINVLQGEMSLVGPRPLQLRDCLLLSQAEPEGFALRHKVPPGMTGLWQISDRSETGFAHMIRLDLEYIGRWSLGFDLQLLMQTVSTVITGRGMC